MNIWESIKLSAPWLLFLEWLNVWGLSHSVGSHYQTSLPLLTGWIMRLGCAVSFSHNLSLGTAQSEDCCRAPSLSSIMAHCLGHKSSCGFYSGGKIMGTRWGPGPQPQGRDTGWADKPRARQNQIRNSSFMCCRLDDWSQSQVAPLLLSQRHSRNSEKPK